jgi:hypothetical protein
MYVKKLESGTFERPLMSGNAITRSKISMPLQGKRFEILMFNNHFKAFYFSGFGFGSLFLPQENKMKNKN